MKQKTIGLELNDKRILLIEVVKERGNILISDLKKYDLPDQVITQGVVKDYDMLSECFRTYCFETKSFQSLCSSRGLFRSVPVIVGISGLHGFNRKLSVPNVPSRELQKIISWEGENILPYPINEVIYGYQILSQSVANYQILFSAVRKDRIDTYMQLFRKFKIPVQILSLQPFGVINVVEYLGLLTNYDGTIVRLGDEECDIVLVFHGEVELVRTIALNHSQDGQKDLLACVQAELLSTIEHFHSLKDIWLNSGIFVGSQEKLGKLREEMPTFHWRYLSLDQSLIKDSLTDDNSEQLPAIFGLTLMGVH